MKQTSPAERRGNYDYIEIVREREKKRDIARQRAKRKGWWWLRKATIYQVHSPDRDGARGDLLHISCEVKEMKEREREKKEEQNEIKRGKRAKTTRY